MMMMDNTYNVMNSNEASKLATVSTTFGGAGYRWSRKEVAGSKNQPTGCRFIPMRSATDFDAASYRVMSTEYDCLSHQSPNESFQAGLAEGLGVSLKNYKPLAFNTITSTAKKMKQTFMAMQHEEEYFEMMGGRRCGRESTSDVPVVRPYVSTAVTRTLDAPGMLTTDDVNLLSWGTNNTLAVALEQTVYLWNASTGSIEELMSLPEDSEDVITSVSWMGVRSGNHLAIGTTNSTVQIWDASQSKKVRTMGGHSGLVGALAWNDYVLSSGSEDTRIVNHDVRIKQHKVSTFKGHSQPVCGLAWSPDGRALASGGGDNEVCLWDGAQSGVGGGGRSGFSTSSTRCVRPRSRFQHEGPVKAVAWSPHDRHALATGGGLHDNTIKLWDTGASSSDAALVKSVDTGSQVSCLVWNPNHKELLSGHGDSLTLWNCPTMTRRAELKGHRDRVLHVAASPDGSSVVSAGADEALLFWNVFGSGGVKTSGRSSSVQERGARLCEGPKNCLTIR